MPDPIAWDTATRVAARVAGRDPFADSYHADSLAADFEELTAEAEALVGETTGLRSLAGPARARVTDRPGWVQANVASFRRMLRPLTEKLGERVPPSGPAAAITRNVAGAEVGAMLGWMSTRVLGQYDLLIVEEEDADDQDIVYYVGPNILALEKRFGFPPREFRLWLALHEVTHRAQFTGIPWLRAHFLSLVDESLANVDPDPKRLVQALRTGDHRDPCRAQPARRGRAGGPAGDRRAARDARAHRRDDEPARGPRGRHDGPCRRPPHPLRRALQQRAAGPRAQKSKPAKVLHQLIGLEAKMNQYAQGEAFIAEVEGAGGTDLLEQAWVGPEWLPTIAEIRSPQQWIDRASRARAGVVAGSS
jgi:uncharacterized protein (DUF2342 family)